MKIVITGKTGSGKSELLKNSTYKKAIDMDSYVKEHFYTNPKNIELLVNEFGKGILNKDGSISFPELGKLVIGNKKNMDKLEKHTLPFIYEEIRNFKSPAVVELPIYLIHEDYFKNLFNYVILIESKNRNLDDKFEYLNLSFEDKEKLFEYKDIRFDYKIFNESIEDSVNVLNQILDKQLNS